MGVRDATALEFRAGSTGGILWAGTKEGHLLQVDMDSSEVVGSKACSSIHPFIHFRLSYSFFILQDDVPFPLNVHHRYLSIHTNILRVLDVWCVALPHLMWFPCACAYPITQSLCCTLIWASPATRARRHDTLSGSMMYLTPVACPTGAGVVDLAPIVAVPSSLAPATTQSPGGDLNPQVVEAPSYTSFPSVCMILFNRCWDIS